MSKIWGWGGYIVGCLPDGNHWLEVVINPPSCPPLTHLIYHFITGRDGSAHSCRRLFGLTFFNIWGALRPFLYCLWHLNTISWISMNNFLDKMYIWICVDYSKFIATFTMVLLSLIYFLDVFTELIWTTVVIWQVYYSLKCLQSGDLYIVSCAVSNAFVTLGHQHSSQLWQDIVVETSGVKIRGYSWAKSVTLQTRACLLSFSTAPSCQGKLSRCSVIADWHNN